jgi:asparagine synthase (glutamine-hydrolysing)
MCGIAGIVSGSPGPSRDERDAIARELERLTRALRHRGPDGSGVTLQGGVGLAQTRLAVLDLSPTGAQPMATPDGRHFIVYNGEVYNFAALRRELEAAGERFAGRSDTEVVLRLLAREGPAGLARLDGMFALALLDVRAGEVLLARDRMGQKPLYLAARGTGWAFASELLPLLPLPGVDASLSAEALSLYLSVGYLPAPYTLRRGIRQLEPGSWCVIGPGGALRAGRFVEPPGPRRPVRAGDLDALADGLEELLSASVRDCLVADVPVGVLLSGGVDSSTIAALAARHTPRLRTFALVHPDPAYDERAPARAVASAIGSEHTEVDFSESPLREEELDLFVDHHGDPFVDTASLAVRRLSVEMRKHVTVALSGDGADEVFAGYDRYAELRRVCQVAALPEGALAAGEALASRFPGRRPRQVARALRMARLPELRRRYAVAIFFWPEEQRELLQAPWAPPGGGEPLDGLLAARSAECDDPVESAHWLEQRMLLPDEMLTKVDRMAMSASLEVRAPFLNAPVLDFAATLPFAAKHRGGESKRVLKTLARRLVPPWVVDRPKRGFAVPLEQVGGRVLDEATRFALESADSPLRGLFRPDALARLAVSLRRQGEGRDPEDSPWRRLHRRWILVVLARALARQGLG